LHSGCKDKYFFDYCQENPDFFFLKRCAREKIIMSFYHFYAKKIFYFKIYAYLCRSKFSVYWLEREKITKSI